MTFLLWLLAIILVWNFIPLVITLCLPSKAPWKHKFKACASFLFSAFPRGLLLILPSFLAPVVVPIALLFTSREADKLPWLFQWWDNDVSINGDREEYWPLDYHGSTYYSSAEPRSFKARFVWLGLRNRASKLAQQLGWHYSGTDQTDREFWGVPEVSRTNEGWTLNRAGGVYQLYIVKKISSGLCIRINYGYKIWTVLDARNVANVINVSFSIISWNGK